MSEPWRGSPTPSATTRPPPYPPTSSLLSSASSAPSASPRRGPPALLIVGGGSNYGKFAVQLAKLAGIGTIVVVGGAGAALRELGATYVVDRYGGYDSVFGRVRAIVGNDLVYALDAVNPPEDQALAVDALSSSKRGTMARLRSNAPADVSRIAGKTAGFDARDVFGLSQMHPALAVPFWERLRAYLEMGKIKPLGYTVVKGLDADSVNAVLDRYKDGETVTKTHVHLS